ncbi:Nse1 non-SMC component of SMC5-6 complex-domain-containing protein [Desarmillaria tabescens]|uniref:Non-structural maintenance of chromosomes element 1 homolog n=1 Tax=Armillaria tabescens TaxID=1929756 RepID=A0AA39KGQ2_ARMTA|nr:Nse1 non-SMC component of SMC5-6 complex-domain-containing protein [Desarmillaria tabescens]KAK0459645.1 Nse1 non-SMC component of SMC5-6 complex-domain-containing protein [Desarmillaria tabescens]
MVSADDVQRVFLQAVLSRGVLSENLAKILWARSVQVVKAVDENVNIQYTGSDASWDDFVAKVNKSLDALDLGFRLVQDEWTGKRMYVLANLKDDEVAQLATDYTAGEIAFFKAVVEQIMLAPHEAYSVSSLAALREVSQVKPTMSKSQAEDVLTSFVANGWLLKSKRGRYSLSVRTQLELQPYLKNTYPDDILECTICQEMVTKGFACHTPNCKVRVHKHCFIQTRKHRSSCPACNIDWPRNADKPLLFVGEGAAREGDDHRRRAKHTPAQSDDDSDEDEDMDASQEQSQSQPKRSQRTRKGKAVRLEQDDDDVKDEDNEDDDESPKKSQPSRRWL